MPIEIVGATEGRERDAAEALKLILDPVFGTAGSLLIVVEAQCLGEEVQDLDLLLLGTFGRGVSFKGRYGDSKGKTVRLVNLCLILELKDHSGKAVRFDSQTVLVSYAYKKFWEDTTKKVRRQRLSLKSYLARHSQPQPWIEGAIWLRNYSDPIPPVVSNVLGCSPSGADFLSLIERIKTPQPDGDEYFIAFTNNKNVTAIQRAATFFRPTLTVTRLDRRRMESICRRLISDQKYIDRLGEQLLIFRGRGGSGKTVHLLRLAKDLYDNGHRVLLLTFNKALVADIRRLLVLLGINNQGFDRGIQIASSHKFFIGLLSAWNLWVATPHGSPFPEQQFSTSKRDLLELLADDTPDSLLKESVVQHAPDIFAWDYVLIDEGQDWPEDERDILYKCFGATRCIVADGVDQLTRGAMPCDWAQPAIARTRQIVPLKRAMRMKSNLCRFIRAFAEEAGGEWDQEVNEEIPGGLITIIRGEYSKIHHDIIFAQHADQGNQPIDALFCVPPDISQIKPLVQARLSSWGLDVWDGTSNDVRDTFPTKREEHRVVRYESCRGLEGWTVICIGLDDFFMHRRRNSDEMPVESLFDTQDAFAHRQAVAWTLIPLTRAIDHLVITLNSEGALTDIFRKLAKQFPDFIAWKEECQRHVADAHELASPDVVVTSASKM